MGKLKDMLFPRIKTPAIEAPARMPDREDPAILEARKKRIAEAKNRGGRADTVLSDALMGSAGNLGS